MKKSLGFTLAGLLLTACVGSVTYAQDKPKAKVRTITGCLSKPEGGDEYQLTAKDGSTWEVHTSSSRVSFAKHVGHTVTATGVVSHQKLHNMKEDAKDTAADAGVKKNTSEHGHLKVTSLKMDTGSCQN